MKAIQVLMVEDNPGDVLLAEQALKEFPLQVKLTTARDGQEALAILSRADYAPDLVILDLNLPKVSGHTVLERYQSELKKTPVVIFSSSWNDADLDRAFSRGAREYVQKPTDLDAFKTAFCGMIRKWAFSEGWVSTPASR